MNHRGYLCKYFPPIFFKPAVETFSTAGFLFFCFGAMGAWSNGHDPPKGHPECRSANGSSILLAPARRMMKAEYGMRNIEDSTGAWRSGYRLPRGQPTFDPQRRVRFPSLLLQYCRLRVLDWRFRKVWGRGVKAASAQRAPDL